MTKIEKTSGKRLKRENQVMCHRNSREFIKQEKKQLSMLLQVP